MFVERKYCEDYLMSEIRKLTKTQRKDIINILHEKYNLQEEDASDILMLREPLSQVSDFILFVFVEYFSPDKMEEYFTPTERAKYSESKLIKEEPIEFPIRINCFEVEPDKQWIGITDANFLVNLSKADIIRYNYDTQRPPTIKKDEDGNITYEITISKGAVKKIRELMGNGNYIPDDITINIPDDADCVYEYDNKNHQLIIKEIKNFDITDGYHRFLAIQYEKDVDKNFNIPMELRITKFSATRAKQFIFQKDQKTKMKKLDSKTFNNYRESNNVVERLNEDVLFNLKGSIGKKGEQIPYSFLSECIDYYYFKTRNRGKADNLYIIDVEKEIRDKFNILTSEDKEYFKEQYDFEKLIIIMYAFSKYSANEELCEKINAAIEKAKDNIDKRKISKGVITKTLVNDIQKLFSEQL